MSIDGKEKNTKSPALRVCRNEGESTKKIEKEQPEREEEKNQECDALDTKQRKSIREEQMPEGLELTIGFGQQKVIDDLGKNSRLELDWSLYKEVGKGLCLGVTIVWNFMRNKQRPEDS